MHIVYSALRQNTVNQPEISQSTANELPEPIIRYQAYQAACQKLNNEILAIQKYLPGWMPTFRLQF
jgi:hypothetical protein